MAVVYAADELGDRARGVFVGLGFFFCPPTRICSRPPRISRSYLAQPAANKRLKTGKAPGYLDPPSSEFMLKNGFSQTQNVLFQVVSFGRLNHAEGKSFNIQWLHVSRDGYL